MIETDEKSQEESSEEEWTYVGGPKIANEDSTDLMTSSIEIQCELPIDGKQDTDTQQQSSKLTLELNTPDLLRIDKNSRCKDIDRLVIQADQLFQKKAQQNMTKKKCSRTIKPVNIEDEGKIVIRAKMSRINEWLIQSNYDKDYSNQVWISFNEYIGLI